MSGKIDHPGARSGTVNRLKGINFTPTDTEPTATKGNMYYDLSEKRLKHHNGTDWVAVNKTINYDRPGDGPYDSDVFTMMLIHSDSTNGNQVFIDSSPEGHTLGYTGSMQHSGGAAKIGATSLLFDGNSDYIHSDLNATGDLDWGTADFTLDFWVNPTSTSLGTVVLSQQYGATYVDSVSWVRWVTSDIATPVLQLNHSGTGNQQVNSSSSSLAAMSIGTWYHYAITRSGGNTHFWRDGVLNVTNSALGSTNFGNPATDGDMKFGARTHGSGWTQWLNGYYDEIRISSKARWTSAFTVY